MKNKKWEKRKKALNILISACLMGINCRYNGKSEKINELEELKNKVDDLCSIDNACFVSYDAIDNSIIPNISVEKLFKKEFKDINPHSLNPNYLKKTEAEEKLNQWLMN